MGDKRDDHSRTAMAKDRSVATTGNNSPAGVPASGSEGRGGAGPLSARTVAAIGFLVIACCSGLSTVLVTVAVLFLGRSAKDFGTLAWLIGSPVATIASSLAAWKYSRPEGREPGPGAG
jgi:hypothetical protein